jgi:hypothetical protein
MRLAKMVQPILKKEHGIEKSVWTIRLGLKQK